MKEIYNILVMGVERYMLTSSSQGVEIKIEFLFSLFSRPRARLAISRVGNQYAVCMYVCHTYSKSMDQPGKVASSARG